MTEPLVSMRHLSKFFTVETSLTDRFRQNDLDLVRAIRFVDPKVAAK